ncbi:MAG: hypothetical protein K6B52_09565 [Clostridiales bacterium]|nr:hypothetical protein [Clostridiales bacterium]
MNFEDFFKKAGRPVTISGDGSERTVFALVTPLRYKNKMYLSGTDTDIGFSGGGYYLYLAPPQGDLTLETGEITVTCGEKSYSVDRAERVYAGSSVYYCWAVLRERNNLTSNI